jgi:glycosyltransferase involved in cell wall biosynthesis
VRILHINKFLYRRGGAESYMLDVAALQRHAGHDVEFFAMSHPLNHRATLERHFPTYIEFDPAPPDLRGKAAAIGRLMYSRSAARGIGAAIDEFRPDVVHAHNVYHQLSPSVLQPVRRRGIPTVMTLHDYKLACPTYLFLDKGRICEACLGGKFRHAVLRRCKDGSLGASAVNAVEMRLHTTLGLYAAIDRFACPSRFILHKMREAGVFPERMRLVPSFIDTTRIQPKDRPGGGIVYVGRIAQEKGVDVLIRAAAGLDVPVDILGDGPEAAEYRTLADATGASNVRFHGLVPRDRVIEALRKAAVCAFPARSYENLPLAVLEAFASGVPVVASRLGGVPELIDPGVDGELVTPEDPVALATALGALVGDPDRALRMGAAGRRKVEARFSPEDHLDRLDALYDEASRRARAGR